MSIPLNLTAESNIFWARSSEELPECKPVIALFKDDGGRIHKVMAIYYPKRHTQCYDFDYFHDSEEDYDYDDSTGILWFKEGWYEIPYSPEYQYHIKFPVTHWISIPGGPREA